MQETNVIKCYPEITIYCEELDQMFDTKIIKIDKSQCHIELPPNPTCEDKVYHLCAYINGKPTNHVTTVTVLGKKLVK